jgi:hypothetical protein
MRKVHLWCVVTSCWGLTLFSQTQPQTARPPADVHSLYVLGSEDSIVIHAADVPELSDKPIRLTEAGISTCR